MKKTVFVTAIGSFSAEAVIGGCRRAGFRVVGCDIYSAEWVVNSREVDGFYQAPYATDRDAYRTFLSEVCKKEQVDFLLPLTDVEVDVLHGWEGVGEALGAVICMSGPEAIALCRDKERMERFLARRGICRTIPGRRLSEVQEAELHFPLVIKPRDGRSSQGLRVIGDREEFDFVAGRLRGEADRYLVQEKIPGRVVTVDVVRDAESGRCVSLPRRELLRTLNGAGTSVQVFRHEALEQQCRDLAEAIGIRGCVNFEFIQQEGTGEFYFLECNPRFSGGVAFSCMAGYDMVGNHLRCFAGQEMEPMVLPGGMKPLYLARRYEEYRMKEEDNE